MYMYVINVDGSVLHCQAFYYITLWSFGQQGWLGHVHVHVPSHSQLTLKRGGPDTYMQIDITGVTKKTKQ